MFAKDTPSLRYVRLLNDTVCGSDVFREGEFATIEAILGSDETFLLEFSGNRLISLASERVVVMGEIDFGRLLPLRMVG